MIHRAVVATVLVLCALGGCSDGSSGDPGDGNGGDSGSHSSLDSGSDSRPSGSDSGSESDSESTSDSGSGSDSSTGGGTDGGTGLFASCSLENGCIADCSPPANDPIATGKPDDDQYDGCILAGLEVAGLTEPWMGQLLKAQAVNESDIVPVITTQNQCGGQNCGIWAISAGAASGDSPPGPCGVNAADPAPGSGGHDYSHS